MQSITICSTPCRACDRTAKRRPHSGRLRLRRGSRSLGNGLPSAQAHHSSLSVTSRALANRGQLQNGRSPKGDSLDAVESPPGGDVGDGPPLEKKRGQQDEINEIVWYDSLTLSKGEGGLADKCFRTLRRWVTDAASLMIALRLLPVVLDVTTSSTTAMATPSYSISQLTTYNLQKLFTAPLLVKLICVMTLSLPLVAVLGGLFSRVKGVPLRDAMLRCYSVLNDCPGADVSGEKRLGPFLVLNLTFLVGVLAYAVLFGVVVEEIQCAVNNFRHGNGSVCLSRHTVVLGWNEFTLPLLRQMAVAKVQRGLAEPVVVLGDLPRKAMEEAIEAHLGDARLDVQVRSGAAHRLVDLDRVAAARASTVVVLDADTEGHNTKKVASVLGLYAQGASAQQQQTVIVQDNDSTDHIQESYQLPLRRAVHDAIGPSTEDRPCARRRARWLRSRGASGGHAALEASDGCQELVFVKDMLDDSALAAQCALQPGMSSVMEDILTQGLTSCEFYIKPFPELAGRTFADASRMFSQAALVGLMEPGHHGRPVINPAGDRVIQSDEQLIGLAQDQGSFQLATWRERSDMAAVRFSNADSAGIRKGGQTHEHPKRVMVLTFGPASPAVYERLAELSPRGSDVVVVAEQQPEGFFRKRNGCRFHWHRGNPACMRSLLDAKLEKADAVIIQGLRHWPADEADARVTASVMLVADAWSQLHSNRDKPLHMVVPVHSPATRQVVSTLLKDRDDVTVSTLARCCLRGGVLAQAASQPGVSGISMELLGTTDGQEMAVTPCNGWLLQNQPPAGHRWHYIQEAARLENRLAVGYIKAGSSKPVLAPRATSQVPLTAEDRMVYIADFF